MMRFRLISRLSHGTTLLNKMGKDFKKVIVYSLPHISRLIDFFFISLVSKEPFFLLKRILFSFFIKEDSFLTKGLLPLGINVSFIETKI